MPCPRVLVWVPQTTSGSGRCIQVGNYLVLGRLSTSSMIAIPTLRKGEERTRERQFNSEDAHRLVSMAYDAQNVYFDTHQNGALTYV